MIYPFSFSFDENFIEAAIVSFTSVLLNADPKKKYELNIFHDAIPKNQLEVFHDLCSSYSNFSIVTHDISSRVANGYEKRGISKVAYSRLYIPTILAHHDKVLHLDVDLVVNCDISEIFNLIDSDKTVLGRKKISLKKRYAKKYNFKDLYINDGVCLYNIKKFTSQQKQQMVDLISAKKDTFLVQHIINFVLRDTIDYSLDPTYNFTNEIYRYLKKNKEKIKGIYSDEFINDFKSPKIIHYTGKKPWNTRVNFSEYWWYYYRRSPIYDFSYFEKFIDFKNK